MTTEIQINEDVSSYQNTQTSTNVTVSYTRTFNNTNWQALYVPFSINSTEWTDNFKVAHINSVRQYDIDHDGAIDETIMDVITITTGTLYPNTPYLIKAKTIGEHTIVAHNVTLSPTEENSFACSTMLSTFTFTGTYNTIPAAILKNNKYYAIGNGNLIVTDGSSDLKPFRWYMTIEPRDPIYSIPVPPPSQIRIRLVGEQDENETHIYSTAQDATLDLSPFNVNGHRISTHSPKGLHISNGKLIFIK